jgi:hypothetical protein
MRNESERQRVLDALDGAAKLLGEDMSQLRDDIETERSARARLLERVVDRIKPVIPHIAHVEGAGRSGPIHWFELDRRRGQIWLVAVDVGQVVFGRAEAENVVTVVDIDEVVRGIDLGQAISRIITRMRVVLTGRARATSERARKTTQILEAVEVLLRS